MSASLYMIASTLTFPVKLVQVDTREFAVNRISSVSKDYDIQFEKDNLLDDLEEEEIINRCHEIIPENVLQQHLITSLESHIKAYDYDAAKKISELDKGFLSAEIKELILMAKLRSELNHSKAALLSKANNFDPYPVKSSGLKEKFEYLLYLQP